MSRKRLEREYINYIKSRPDDVELNMVNEFELEANIYVHHYRINMSINVTSTGPDFYPFSPPIFDIKSIYPWGDNVNDLTTEEKEKWFSLAGLGCSCHSCKSTGYIGWKIIRTILLKKSSLFELFWNGSWSEYNTYLSNVEESKKLNLSEPPVVLEPKWEPKTSIIDILLIFKSALEIAKP
jgi:ubiquitin-protein ligase